MEQRKITERPSAQAGRTEQILASYYSQLSTWGLVLSRGDAARAEELVQEFCLHFSLSRPDLSEVHNLDGYLYTSLRHLYLSGLARSSREALHFISVADFDSIEFALAARQSGDPLQRQNDLRRICGYSVWRKESSKSASYFVLHFFHGYTRREVAELARVPMSAVYNKLKIARAEVKSFLEEAGKLRIVSRDQPPEPVLFWNLLSVGELFQELRETILRARTSQCLSESELLKPFRSSVRLPIECSLLSHIVSCERCLALIDAYFSRPSLQDREPLDSLTSGAGSSDSSQAGDLKQEATFRIVRKRLAKIREHRPQSLSIAVNGKVVAYHDVGAERTTLSVRVENPENARFVEVFSEQDVRFALLSIGELPPEGAHSRSQRVVLSDDRWLELNLKFDGLGLNSEVAYFDPALALDAMKDSEDSEMVWASNPNRNPLPGLHSSASTWLGGVFGRILGSFLPSSAIAWALALAIVFSAAGILTYHYENRHLDAGAILTQSVGIEMKNLQGQTEHQVLRLEESSADRQITESGAVEVWKDGDGGRYLRRLYDSQHRLLATKWRIGQGEHGLQQVQPNGETEGTTDSALMDGMWDQDLSAQSFKNLVGRALQVRAAETGYELTASGPIVGHPQLISATLVLDGRLVPVSETMRIRAGSEVHELRFVQQDYERRPSSSISDEFFRPNYDVRRSFQGRQPSSSRQNFSKAAGMDAQLVQLQISVLYQLSKLDADTAEPIEVVRTPEGRIRVSGTIGDDALRKAVLSQLQTLRSADLLDLRLTPAHVRPRRLSSSAKVHEEASLYDLDSARPVIDGTLRGYFQKKGLSGTSLDSAVNQFTQDVLDHSQRALQHAYALERLGSAISAADLRSVDLASQQEWTEMVHKHAIALQEQLRMLRAQLSEILPSTDTMPPADDQSARIEDPSQFSHASTLMLHRIQTLNSDMGRLFTSGSPGGPQLDEKALRLMTMEAIPSRQSEEITSFADRLNSSAATEIVKRQNSGNDDKVSPHQPR